MRGGTEGEVAAKPLGDLSPYFRFHNMPESLARINEAAFKGCTSLTTVTMCGGVTFIGNNVFNGCTSLTTIKYEGTVKMWHDIGQSTGWNTNTGEYTVVCTDGNISKADS